MISQIGGYREAVKSKWLPMTILVAFALAGCSGVSGTDVTSVPAAEPTVLAQGVTGTVVPTMAPAANSEPIEVATATSGPERVREDHGINPLRDITLQGLAYASEGEYDKAIVEFTKVIQSNPQNWAAYLMRGKIHAENGNHVKAISDHNRAIRLNPESSVAYSSRGLIYSGMEDRESALADFDKAIELNAENAEAYFGRGAILVFTDEYEDGIGDLDKAIEINPDQPSAFRMRGIAYAAGSADYERAISDFDEAVALNSEDAETYLARGLAWFLLKEYDKAIADFDRAAALDPAIGEPLDYRQLSRVLRDGSLEGWNCAQHSEWLKVDNDDTIVDIYDIEETYRSPDRIECIGRAELQGGGDAAITFQMKSNGDASHELTESLTN